GQLAPRTLGHYPRVVVHLFEIGQDLTLESLKLIGWESRPAHELTQDLHCPVEVTAQTLDRNDDQRIADVDRQAGAHPVELFGQRRLTDVLGALAQYPPGETGDPVFAGSFAARAGADQRANDDRWVGRRAIVQQDEAVLELRALGSQRAARDSR